MVGAFMYIACISPGYSANDLLQHSGKTKDNKTEATEFFLLHHIEDIAASLQQQLLLFAQVFSLCF
jgi:hypothetical protein